MNTSQTSSAGFLNLLFGCLLLLLAAMPQAVAQSEAVTEDETVSHCSISSITKSFDAGFVKDEIRNIQKQLFAVGYHPGKIDGLLGKDTYKALGQFCRSLSIDERLNAQKDETPQGVKTLAELIIELLKKADSPPDEPKNILLSGGGCGCSRNFKENSLVYGFYPHWLADDNKHVVDFSLFDRIGFYALELNQQGYVKHRLQWPSDAEMQPNVADFISQAHKHMVDVDVTFYASSWQNWEYEQIDRATDIIVDTVTRDFESAAAPWWRKYMPFVASQTTASADGVNLFFDDYADSGKREKLRELLEIVNRMADSPERLEKLVELVNEQAVKPENERNFQEIGTELGGDQESGEKLPEIVNSLAVKPESGRKLLEIVRGTAVSGNGRHLADIVKALALKLKPVESDVKLNIMLGLNLAYVDKLQLAVENQTAEQFVEQYRTLENEFRKLEGQFKSLEKILDADPKMVDNVFVFLTQDTSKSKKNLRQIIENAFEGAARQTILRKIVPIVVAQGLAEQEVKDEVEYGKGITQFKDDLIYMQNNFAGIGLWHLSLTQSKEDSEDEVAKKEVAEKEAAEIAAAAKDAAAAAKEAAARATAATEAAENASGDDAAAMKQAAEQAAAEKEIAEKEALEKAGAAKAAEKKVEAMSATAEKKAAAQADVDTLRRALEEKFQISGEFAFLGETIEPYANDLCEYACPNRWRFRIAFNILLALAVIYALLALRNCQLREFYQRRFPYFAGFGLVTAMIFTVTLVCDPFWRQRVVYVLIGILLLIISGYGLRRLKKTMQATLP